MSPCFFCPSSKLVHLGKPPFLLFSLRCKLRLNRSDVFPHLGVHVHRSHIHFANFLVEKMRSVNNSPYRKNFGIIPSKDCSFPCLVVTLCRHCRVLFIAQARFYHRSVVFHSERLPSRCHRCCPKGKLEANKA